MKEAVLGFEEVTQELQQFAGGKGAVLSMLYQRGFPVPEGLVVLPEAMPGGSVKQEARELILSKINVIRKNHPTALFAVRSSGLSEDSAGASFAGGFESVLDVDADEQIWSALQFVYQSQFAERVAVYSQVQGIDQSQRMAIVIQRMIMSDLSGVLFTVNPLTGSRVNMTGNYVQGLGEELVSGEANAVPFTLSRLRGEYTGPSGLRKYASKLFRCAARIEKQMGYPQDIEWSVSGGELYILQARPVTTLGAGNLNTYECNDSLTGDFLWTNTNVGESISDVLTPLSWSILRALDEEHNVIPGHYMLSGNICGRVYSNISLPVSAMSVMGARIAPLLRQMSNVFGELPQGVSVPVYPFGKRELIRIVGPGVLHSMRRTRQAIRNLPRFLEQTAESCRMIRERLQAIQSREELLLLWNRELWPQNVDALWNALEGTSAPMQKYIKQKRKLIKLVGTQDANILLSSSGKGRELESLGPLLGLSRIIHNQLSRRAYVAKYGHRGPHEFELSIADLSEDEDRLELKLSQYRDNTKDIEELLNKQRQQHSDACARLRERFPHRWKSIYHKLSATAQGPQMRESARSEWTRVYRLNRDFAIKAGELAGIGGDVFFLYLSEILQGLEDGKQPGVQYIAARKETFARYQKLPPLPSVIRGRFDPYLWMKDPRRRIDLYDPEMPMKDEIGQGILRGSPGAAGIIEGVVRVLAGPEDGNLLLPGEILVASTTNVGWTLCFPRAVAIITDIGAPLSHAAIIARELGIPAVFGCGNATTRLHTGDCVRVDGGNGMIQIITSASGGDHDKMGGKIYRSKD
ncbi:PEP/pyruvate-binding domain-containing protein [Paenibacillus sp. FSL R7-0337]|uniref:PEP/pyruvate-binding domain-containing protein n=1 Tax=Paenibacillus sp. FSL R7-0337 TaxID=1926588 RepID=UPI00096C81DE|nr:PEP/pyruvate-binding domain-containing protein [Paenibacillus sp. FSL R7-0337]OMF97051.1 phosphoenolpyruvate synthase [Paenibacillus sp. FSL R7-0337]